MTTAVHVVSKKKVFGCRRVASAGEDQEEIIEIAVDITDDKEIASQIQKVWLTFVDGASGGENAEDFVFALGVNFDMSEIARSGSGNQNMMEKGGSSSDGLRVHRVKFSYRRIVEIASYFPIVVAFER
jgi:hypothetical protein